ncbi:MAG: zinc ABC transporter substrate-binding protein [Burkholderiaceae bacterium]
MSARGGRRTLLCLLSVLGWAASIWATPVSATPVRVDGERLAVVASFSILADMVREVGGDAVSVVSLVGPDGDPHVFEPSPQDVGRLQQARVVVGNGLGFENWLPRLVQSAQFRGVEILATQGVRVRIQKGLHGRASPDPHAWQDIGNALIYVANIERGLIEADPAGAAGYRARAADYAARLGALDARIRQTFTGLPPAQRSVVVSHDAFGYYGDAYGLRFVAAHRAMAGVWPTARGMASLIERIRREGISAVFVENIADPRLMVQLVRETGAVMGGRMYSDALPSGQGPAASYIGMMEANTATLIEALGSVP